MLEDTSERMSRDMSERMSEDMSEDMSERTFFLQDAACVPRRSRAKPFSQRSE